jgi:hypothetical protein
MLDIETLEKTLRLVKFLQKINHPLSGVIIQIRDVGHALYWGASFEDMEKAYLHFRKENLDYQFTIVGAITRVPAQLVMEVIHFLNDVAGLPGLVKYLEQLRKAA